MEVKRPLPWLIAILVAAAVLRIVSAATLPLWMDEAITWDNAQKPWASYLDWSHNPLHAPLSYILVRFSIGLFGHNELALRLPSVLAGIVNVYLVYLLGKRMHSPALGPFAAALFAVDPLLVRVDAYARMYSLWMSGCFASILAALWVDRQTADAPRMMFKAWFVLALALTVAFWTHPLSIYLWVAVLGYLGLRGLGMLASSGTGCTFKHRLAGLSLASMLVLVLGIPGLNKLLTRTAKATAETEGKHGFSYMLMDFAGTGAWPAVWLAALAGLAWLFARKTRGAGLLVLLMACALLIIGVGKQHHHLTAHYLYPLAISVYLGIAALLLFGLDLVRAHLKPALFTVAALLVLGGSFALRTSQTTRRIHGKITAVDGGYEGARLLKYVAQHSGENDAAILIPPWLGFRASFYEVPARRLSLERRGHLWVDDFRYNADELDPAPESLWFVIETWCGMRDKRRLTKAELQKFLTRVMKEPPGEAQLEHLASKNVIRIQDGRIESFTTSEIMKGSTP